MASYVRWADDTSNPPVGLMWKTNCIKNQLTWKPFSTPRMWLLKTGFIIVNPFITPSTSTSNIFTDVINYSPRIQYQHWELWTLLSLILSFKHFLPVIFWHAASPASFRNHSTLFLQKVRWQPSTQHLNAIMLPSQECSPVSQKCLHASDATNQRQFKGDGVSLKHSIPATHWLFHTHLGHPTLVKTLKSENTSVTMPYSSQEFLHDVCILHCNANAK